MCEPASMVVTKKQVFWSKTSDSHEEIIEEFGLKERDTRGDYTFVRVEITPPDRDFSAPLRKWQYKLDETDTSYLPKWYEEKGVEKKVRIALKDWRKQKIIMPNQAVNELKNDDYILVCYGSVENVRDSATIKNVYGSATIEYVCDSATIKNVYGSATIKSAKGHSTVTVYIKVDRGFLQSAHAVLIDRSSNKPKCYVRKGRRE